MVSLLFLLLSISARAEGLPEFPLPKEQVNSCLEAVHRVGYYLACAKSADTITGPACQAMRRERFRSPPLRNAKGLNAADISRDVPYSVAEAAKLLPADGSGAVYRKALWDTAKAVDKKLLLLNLGAWAAEIGSWYFVGTGRLVLGSALNLGGWGITAYTGAKVAKDVSEAAKKHLVKAHWHVRDCFEGENEHALGEAQIRSCLEQRLPHQSVVGVFSGLLASGREGELARDQLRALASEGYAWELPAAQYTVACGLIQSLDDQFRALEAAPVSCDKASGLVEINGKKFRQAMELDGTEIRHWSLESAEPFVEVKEGILRRVAKKKAHINLVASPLPDDVKERVDLGEAMSRQAALLAPRLLEMKDCGAKKPARRPLERSDDSRGTPGHSPAR